MTIIDPIAHVRKDSTTIVMVALAEEGAPEVLERAALAARAWEQCELHIVHIVTPNIPPASASDELEAKMLEEQLKEGRRFLGGVGDLTIKLFPGDVVMHLVVAQPCEGILRAAQRVEADLLVVGTHDYRGVKRFFLGSVASDVVKQAQCPVLVARPHRYTSDAVPKIEPLCAACAKTRADTAGATLWCDRHLAKHPRARLHYEYPSGFGAGSQLLDV